MRIGILQTGKVNAALEAAHGEYPAMMAALFTEAAPDFTFRTYVIVDDDFPATPTECDGWLVTGSRHGVYDDLPWIAPLKDFLRAAREAGQPILGICFGHQILAEAFGGRAAKSAKGWGLGLESYQVTARPSWMAGAPERLSMHAIHQDQVEAIPTDATLLATSPHCRFAMLAYGDPEAPDAVTIQPHPECNGAYTRALIDVLESDGRAPGAITDAARAATGSETALTPDARAFAEWSTAFLRGAAARARAA